ncbi:MAG: sugar ABC transporter permease [Trueperaceae bacterium]|nr:sugar ABC transporter permease [Trueperaceae bacterium]
MTSHVPDARGWARSLLTLVGSLTLAIAAGVWGFWLLQALVPAVPAYTVLIVCGLAIVPVLAATLRRFPRLGYWYYFLPALLFLVVFTIYPIFLTVTLAFTDYSGARSGQANRVTQTEVRAVEGSTLTLAAPAAAALRCQEACVGRRVEVGAGQQRVKLAIAGVDGVDLTLAQPPPFGPDVVSIVSDFGFVGLRNFTFIMQRATRSLVPVLTWNLVFAVLSVVGVGAFGALLAIVLNDKTLKLRGLYRTLLIISWAVPGVISIQMWQALLNYQFGAVNRLLGLFGIYPIPWLLDPMWAKASVLLVNFWLGFPFMMVAALGVLATIPDELYEAARIDGASPWQALRTLTLPLLYPPMLPVLLTAFAFNFNNFNVIYLLTAGGPAQEGRLATAQATDILISWAYKTAFSTDGQSAYGLGAAISILIFAVTIAISYVNFRATGVLKEAQA